LQVNPDAAPQEPSVLISARDWRDIAARGVGWSERMAKTRRNDRREATCIAMAVFDGEVSQEGERMVSMES
jgi:hypothetical protein